MAANIGNPHAFRLRGLLAALAVRPRVFISYHHHGDQLYYDVLTKAFADQHEIIHDASLERIRSDDVDYVSWRIRDEYIRGTSCTVVLCGAQTPNRKYVDWEVKDTLDMEHGLVAIGLPNARRASNGATIVPDRVNDNVQSAYAVWVPDWLTLAPGSFAGHIAEARRRAQQQKYLIRNTRPMMAKNT
jgi:hypothetical protein